MGLDPAPGAPGAVATWCDRVLTAAAPACVAAKFQLACFERLGAGGWSALERATERARALGLLVIADGKRGDVPVSAVAYADGLFGRAPGLGADAATVSPLLGGDALDPFVDVAAERQAGIFVLVRTSNPGASDLLDLDAGGCPLHERIAGLVAERAPRLRGEGGLSGLGAVVGATEPQHIERLRALMPDSIFLLPGVGAQGGDPDQLGAAFAGGAASAIVTASRSIAGADDPAAAAESLRERVWDVACRATATG